MDELKEGIVTTSELREWFGGMLPPTWSQQKDKKLEVLNKFYCTIEPTEVRGKYFISNIREGIYDKNKKMNKTREFFIDTWKEGEAHVISKRVELLFPEFKKIEPDASYKTVLGRVYKLKKKYLRRVR